MQTLLKVVGILVAVVAIYFVIAGALSELQEVVIIQTLDDAGETQKTRVWVADVGGAQHVRGSPLSGWVQRVKARGVLELERNGSWKSFTAGELKDGGARTAVHDAMAEKYGLADRMIGVTRDETTSTIFRLEAKP